MKSDKNYVQGEAVIFGMHLRSTVVYSESSFSVDKDCVAITLKDGQDALLKYIYYYLLANENEWKRYYVGTTLHDLSKVDLQFVRIVYPSIELQHHIVAIFDLLFDSLEKRKESRAFLHKFLVSYYIYLKKTFGRFWTNTQEVSSALLGRWQKEGKAKEKSSFLPFFPFQDGLKVVLNGNVYSFFVNRKVCNPYYLAVALSASIKVGRFFENKSRSNLGINSLHSNLSEIIVAIPDKGVQDEFEKRYNQIESLDDVMCQFIEQAERLRQMMLSSLLSRKSEKSIWNNHAMQDIVSTIDTDKLTYKDYRRLTRLSEYDEKRDSLFELLEKGNLVQYFDENEGIIKFRATNLVKS